MGAAVYASTLPGGVTPTCSDCGVALCWDISKDQYEAEKDFWDQWLCQDCNGGQPMSLQNWRVAHGRRDPPNQTGAEGITD